MSALAEPRRDDPHDVRRARNAPGLLRAFNDIGVLAAADVHVAVRARARSPARPTRRSRSPPRSPSARRASATSTSTWRRSARPPTVESDEPVDLTALPWPEVEGWIARARGEPARRGRRGPRPRAARCGSSARRSTSTATGARSARSPPTCARSAAPRRSTSRALADGLDAPVRRARRRRRCQRAAAATAVRRRFAVVAGGPGHGQDDDGGADRRAARRAGAAAGARAARRARGADRQGGRAARGGGARRGGEARRRARASATALLALNASTLHRLLGWRPDSHSRFRHNRGNRLPHDVVIVDETSMVSLSLMARLVEAVRPEARLVLVGDPGQLTSIEAGAVLGDIVRAGGDGRRRARARLPLRRRDRRARRRDPHRRRRRGDRGARAPGHEDVTWIPVDVGDPAAQDALAPVRDGRGRGRARGDRRGPRGRRARRRSRRSARSGCCARIAAARTA